MNAASKTTTEIAPSIGRCGVEPQRNKLSARNSLTSFTAISP
jgi:hypothetical protein